MALHIGHRFRHLNGAMWVMWRRIYRVNFERTVSDINDVVPCSSRNKNCVSGADWPLIIEPVFSRSHHNHAVAAFNPQELIGIRMYFQTNFPINRYTH